MRLSICTKVSIISLPLNDIWYLSHRPLYSRNRELWHLRNSYSVNRQLLTPYFIKFHSGFSNDISYLSHCFCQGSGSNRKAYHPSCITMTIRIKKVNCVLFHPLLCKFAYCIFHLRVYLGSESCAGAIGATYTLYLIVGALKQAQDIQLPNPSIPIF